eukprot:753386-Hanusia_phi.AAC.1
MPLNAAQQPSPGQALRLDQTRNQVRQGGCRPSPEALKFLARLPSFLPSLPPVAALSHSMIR